jgi:hypothetical protein
MKTETVAVYGPDEGPNDSYLVLCAGDLGALASVVQSYILQGYIPQGGIAVNEVGFGDRASGTYAQAMIRKDVLWPEQP